MKIAPPNFNTRHQDIAYAATTFVILGFVFVGTGLVKNSLINFLVMSVASVLIIIYLAALIYNVIIVERGRP